MENSEKLTKLLNAIDSIEDTPDGSIIINWKSSVAHEVNGFMLFNSSDSCVMSGRQVHINPVIPMPATKMDHSVINKELQLAVEREQEIKRKKKQLVDQGDCDCDCKDCNDQSQYGSQ